jgi:translation initiation factor 5A
MAEVEGGGVENIQSMDLEDVKELQQPVPIQASHCRKGVFVVLQDCPCKVNDLKVSKTGKHGSAKANIVGYDVITGKKIQETAPGHATYFAFTPSKIDYEVADINDGQITAMTPDGQEYFFNVPANEEVGEKLVKEFKENTEKNGDQYFTITVLYAPRMVGKKWMANMLVESYKASKPE